MVKEYVPELLAARSHGKALLKPVSSEAARQFQAGRENFYAIAGMMCSSREDKNLETYLDCFEENGTAYAVTEYLNGLTIQEIMNQGKLFAYQEARYLISQVLTGVSALHELGMIHMDLSPTNIFYTVDGKVKILDVGAYRYTPGDFKSLSDLARSGFAAEEQYRSSGELGTCCLLPDDHWNQDALSSPEGSPGYAHPAIRPYGAATRRGKCDFK